MNKIYRISIFLISIFAPVFLSWWLFLPIAILAIYLFGLPYEIIVSGIILDLVYYFGDGFWADHRLTLIALALIWGAIFLGEKIHWQKIS